ncbi:MAG: ISAs1 family transposase [Spirochaetaceae bacterium]|nr:ISAs1 family transposase [Spirochaetaceae bacterium]
MEVTEGDIARMEECLSGIKDERRQSGHFPHKLIGVLVIGLTTILAGWDEYTVMEDFGKANEGFLRTFLELPHGIPDEKTFARVFSWAEPGALLSGLQTWLMGVNKDSGRSINIDGKTICGSGCKGRNAAPNQAWADGITYIHTGEGFPCLGLITDLFSRKTAGRHAGDTLEAEGTARALDLTLKELSAGAFPIHHSDRGCQYCSHRYVEKLTSRGLPVNMT